MQILRRPSGDELSFAELLESKSRSPRKMASTALQNPLFTQTESEQMIRAAMHTPADPLQACQIAVDALQVGVCFLAEIRVTSLPTIGSIPRLKVLIVVYCSLTRVVCDTCS